MSKEPQTTKDEIREAIERAIMQLTAFGANNTNYLREAIEKLENLVNINDIRI